ncbi:T-cell immunoglobulin and mucin domain-containing protein 4 isoform X2 [Suricata suricatta]|uniref:T-cell immunoglobulin and mucin domain-containing protein 4 isoform X2 n=1 Tax=Suricata suricatta TaxID=37032 RepID=UPI00115557CD|nr:T-cell immunoglobulin and mucin domain-containing protein 4 isoform X2 [Suricata suricatta]
MSKGPLILWLLIELGRLSLISAAPETVRGYLGQTVTLPCKYSSWSKGSHSMCWGKGECPNSKCTNELLHTDGMKVLSRKSSRYELQGNIREGNVSLTIFNTNEGDNSVYCCRVEVPGWFNDMKKNIHLQLRRAVTTPELTTRAPLQTTLTTVATTCPPTVSTFLTEATTVLQTTEPSMGAPTLITESETFFLSSDSETSTKVTSGNIAMLTSRESEGWVLQSTSQASMWDVSDSVTFAQPGASETAMIVQNEAESEEVKMVTSSDLLMITVPSAGFVLLVLLVAFFLRGKVVKTNCFQKHTRFDNVGECKNTSEDMQHGREDEDGLFTL